MTYERPQQLRYVDVEDRAWQEFMQNPDTQQFLENQWLNRHLEDWPDQILLAELPQVPEEQIDEPIVEIVGRCSGDVRDVGAVSIDTARQSVLFRHSKSTKFVRVIRHGSELMERWDIGTHGEWEVIPDIGLTPPQLLEQLYGHGESQIDEGQQFQNVRKQGASKTNWPASRHPKPLRRTLR